LNRAEYDRGICSRLAKAEGVKFRKVSLGEWIPIVGDCHNNVDRWVGEVLGHRAVRGWVSYKECIVNGRLGLELTAHSVVRDENGGLFDITPLCDERMRGGMRFVEHIGDESLFWAVEKTNRFICCPA
jgi:hypothetical protein